MSPSDPIVTIVDPPISVTAGTQPQETLLQRGAFNPPATPGTLGSLDRFEILRLLGEGGMGQVYLAREPRTNTRVAIKILRPQMADDPQMVHRFLTEARHMYRLSHPRILRVLEVSDRKEGPYYVMPYVEGGSLLGQYKPSQPLPVKRILAIAGQMAEALAYAHAHGLIHRDLKPGNVLLDKGDIAYLTDFGLVRTLFNDSMVDVSASHLEGTAPYMSPAVACGEAEDTRCDIYAFGALLYELLTGQPPYSGRTPQIILDQVRKGPPISIRDVNASANSALTKIAEVCMARELRDRYASMADVKFDIDRVAQGKAPLGSSLRLTRKRWFGGMGLIALTVVGLVAAWTVRHNDRRTYHSGDEGNRGVCTDMTAAVLAPSGAVTASVETAKGGNNSARNAETNAQTSGQLISPPIQTAEQGANARAIAEVLRLGGKYWTTSDHGVPPHSVPSAVPDPSSQLFRAFLENTRITDDSLRLFAGLSQLDGLYLSNTRVTDAGLAYLRDLPKLHNLYLDGTQISDAGLAHLKELPELSVIMLARTRVSNAGLVHLKGLTQLDRLDLSGTSITDAGLLQLERLGKLNGLYLSDNAVGDAALQLAGKLPNLQILYLGRTHITDAGLQCLRDKPQFNMLLLDETAITDVGLEYLQGMTRLDRLLLRGTQITDAGLKGMNALTVLGLEQTKVTASGVKEIRETLPKCRIISDSSAVATNSIRPKSFGRTTPAEKYFPPLDSSGMTWQKLDVANVSSGEILPASIYHYQPDPNDKTHGLVLPYSVLLSFKPADLSQATGLRFEIRIDEGYGDVRLVLRDSEDRISDQIEISRYVVGNKDGYQVVSIPAVALKTRGWDLRQVHLLFIGGQTPSRAGGPSFSIRNIEAGFPNIRRMT